MFKHILTWLVKSVSTFLFGLPITILSSFVTAIALPFRVEHPETDTPFREYPVEGRFHRLVTLPRWARWWDNIYDGMWGDKRGWWNWYTGDCRTFLSMWLWNGVRNPANYFGRHIKGIDMARMTVVKLAGADVVIEEPGVSNWQFLVATDRINGRQYHRLFCSWAWWFKPEKGFQININ